MEDIRVIIGGNFGDEGKGLMTQYFARDAERAGMSCLVVCSNGGAQRGHTVRVSDEVRHVFHHFGSGTFAGAATGLPYFFILNPMLFVKEYFELLEEAEKVPGLAGRGLPEVFVDPECPVSTPFDMILNQILEESRGSSRHGSCGMGIWETLIRDGIRWGRLTEMDDDGIRSYLKDACRDQLWKRLESKGVKKVRNEWREIINDDGLIEHYIEDLRIMQNICKVFDIRLFDSFDRVIFENGQGLLLDRCRREYGNNTTPSNTGLRNPAALLREYVLNNYQSIDMEVCYVTRTYLTRHGAGRFDEECDKAEINPDMVDLTNVPNPHQGTLRYGKLDKEGFLKRIRNDFDSERLPENFKVRRTIAVTHVNEYLNDISNEADYISYDENSVKCFLDT